MKHPGIAGLPHRVYRCYGADDQLVYVGVTSMPVQIRLRKHRTLNPAVWAATFRVEATEYPDKATAYDAEARAIYAESPSLNRRQNYKRFPVEERLAHAAVRAPEKRGPTKRDLKRASLLALAAERASP